MLLFDFKFKFILNMDYENKLFFAPFIKANALTNYLIVDSS
jgi:hypothetical protein